MKNILFLLLAIGLLSACKEKKKPAIATVNNAVVTNEKNQELYGVYVGNFDVKPDDEYNDEYADSKIGLKLVLLIKRISGDTVYAQSKAFGRTSSLTGSIEKDGANFAFALNEELKDERGGTFIFKLENDAIVGDFKPLDTNDTYSARHFKLTKKRFEYNAKLMLVDDSSSYVDWSKNKMVRNIIKNDDGTIDTAELNFSRSASKDIFSVNASTTALTEASLKNLRKLDLEIIRNTIFARHGYAFQKETFRSFFDPIDWYLPLYKDVNEQLTVLEKTNISLLKRFEKYAEDNYDAFGR